MLKSIKVFLVILWYCLMTSPLAYGHVITCADWVSKPLLDGGRVQNEESSAISADESGIKEACRDGQPTMNERFKIKRLGDTPETANYEVTTQYCWFRGASGYCQVCGDWNWAGAYCDAYDDQWGQTASKNFTVTEVGKTKRVGAWAVCTQRTALGEEYWHGGKNEGEVSQICAYVTTSLTSDDPTTGCSQPWFSTASALIGCVDELVMPGPPTFNLSLVGSAVPSVDTDTPLQDAANASRGYIPMGSRFDRPMVRLVQYGPNKTVLKDLLLFYAFPGDQLPSDKVNCAQFPMPGNTTLYCAMVPPDDPGKVCACEQEECDKGNYLGCVPRPKPSDSQIAIIPRYAEYETPDYKTFPGLVLDFVPTRPDGVKLIYDASGDLVDRDIEGKFYKYDETSKKITAVPAVLPLKYDRLPMPFDTDRPLLEYYTIYDNDKKQWNIMRDKKIVYGVTFKSIIPQLDSSGNMKTVQIILPGQQDCGIFSLVTDPLDTRPEYILPAGNRDRSYCCPTTTVDKTQCMVPPPTPCKDGSLQSHNSDATLAFCPGVYTGPKDPNKPDQLCLMVDPIWPIISPKDRLCIMIPSKCWAASVPTAQNGFATWSRQAEANETQTGTCDSSYGLDIRQILTVVPNQKIASLPEGQQTAAAQELVAMQATLQQLQQQYDALNLNIPASALPTGTYYTYANTPEAPQRYCDPGTNTGTIYNACVRTAGCGAITQASEASGFAIWSDNSSAASTPQPSKDGNDVTVKTVAVGQCGAGYQVGSAAPQRNCITAFRLVTEPVDPKSTIDTQPTSPPLPKKTFKMLYQYWDNPANTCIPVPQK